MSRVGKPAKSRHMTLAVSPEFAAMVGELAKAARLSVRDYCDQQWAPKLSPAYAATLKAKLATATAKRGA